MVGAMAMETTQGMVLHSCMSVWRMPGKNQHLWPHVKKHALPWLYRSVSNYKAVRHGDGTPSSTALRPFLPEVLPCASNRTRPRHSWSCITPVASLVRRCVEHVVGQGLTEGIFNPRGPTTSGTTETVHWRSDGVRRGARTEAWMGRHTEEGDWQFSPEWWGTQGGGWGRNAGDTVFESQSAMGNGVISVTSHPASTPRPEEWAATERALQERESQLKRAGHRQLKVLGYEWRVLRFNAVTRQSVAKVMAVSNDKHPSEVFLIQQPNCIAFEYVKSMLSVGLTTMSLGGYSLEQVKHRMRDMRFLCIGLGGGSLPLFLAHNLPGAILDVVEIDGAVIEAAVETMGFPPCKIRRLQSAPEFEARRDAGKEHGVLWDSVNRMTVYEADGEAFVEDRGRRESTKERQYYDLVFVDAFDGEDVVPTKLWTRNGPFLTYLSQLLHPKHGTVVVNLHTDAPPPSILEKATGQYGPGYDPSSPQGRKIQEACWTYRDALISTATGASGGIAFTVAVPSQGNISLVASRGLSVHRHLETTAHIQHQGREKQMFNERLIAESKYVQKVLNSRLDFSRRVSRGFQVVQERIQPAKVR